MKKRILTLVLASAMMISTLAGCAQSSNANNSTSSTPQTTTTSTDGDITVAAASLGSTLNPLDQTDGTTSAFQYATYDALVAYKSTKDANGNDVADTEELVGNLAKSWDTTEDGLVWTFHLNPEAKFANGDKVTAEDVIWSFEQCKESANQSFFFGLTNITTMESPDEETVVFTLSARCNMFLRLIEIYPFLIINKSEAEEKIAEDKDYLTKNTCGSGPYKITTYDTTAKVVLERRDDYWNKDNLPKNKTVTWQNVPEASDRQLLLENGDVDIALDLEDKSIEQLKTNDALTIRQDPSNKHLYLSLNTQIAPFDNVKVREAMAYVIPYDDLTNQIMYGNATRMTSFIPDNVSGHIAEEGKTYVNQDLDKAKALLAEAGYPDGFSCTFTLGTGFTDWKESAVTLQAELAKIGVKMDIKETDRAQFLKDIAEGNVPMFFNRFNPFIGDPGYLVGNVHVSQASFNYVHYKNDEFDSLFDQAEAATDEKDRLSIYGKMQEIFFEDAPTIPIYQYNYAYCASNKVSGYVFYPDLTLRFNLLAKA